MTNLNTGNRHYHGIQDEERARRLKEDYKNTVKANPNKKYILDPFVGWIERKEK